MIITTTKCLHLPWGAVKAASLRLAMTSFVRIRRPSVVKRKNNVVVGKEREFFHVRQNNMPKKYG